MSSRRRLAAAAVGLAVSLAALAILSQLVDLRATLDVLSRTDPLPLIVALGVIGLQLVLRSLRWSLLLPAVGDGAPSARHLGVRRVLPVLLVGYLGNICLPARLGEVVRAYLVSRRESVPFSMALGSVLLERVMDLASLAVVGWVAAVVANAPDWIVKGTAVVALAGVAVTGFLVIVGLTRIVRWTRGLLERGAGRLAWLAGALARFAEGAGEQPRPVIAICLAISVGCWLLDGTTFWLAGRAIGADLAWGTALLIAAVTVLGTAIPSAPGYIGTFELAAVAAGEALGVGREDALAIGVLAHVITTIPLAIGGVLSLAQMSLSLGGVSADAAARRDEAAT